MPKFENIVQTGNRGFNPYRDGDSLVTCKDGFTLSVIAGGGTYCTPRPALTQSMESLPNMYDVSSNYAGPYTAVEVGFPSEVPEPWDVWSRSCEDTDYPTETVYGYVPVDQVRALIELHGGEIQ